ncbi:MAG: MgtC/SapB family protein [Bacteroidales bacterium]
MTALLPPDGTKIILVLFLSFLVGLEREEHKATSTEYAFGGVRTYPLIGLVGYGLSLLSAPGLTLVSIGFAVVGGFMLLSYWRKLSASGLGGATSEMTGLAVYVVGALVQHDFFWIATTLVVVSLMLLELKVGLESLARRMAPDEIFTFAKFLLLTAVILPILPNQPYGPFSINPFRTWLIVVAVSGVSYGSYVLQKVTRLQGGVLLAAVLGGTYSSTVMTVVLSRRAAREHRPHLFAGATLMASSMMYLRLAVLVSLFNATLGSRLGPMFALLAVTGLVVGFIWSRLPDDGDGNLQREFQPGNPLEIGTALLFGAIFLAMLVATQLAVTYLGKAGVYVLGAVMGLTDVDPYIMGMTQNAGMTTPLAVAATGIMVAASANNLAKGIYAFTIADRRTGVQSLIALLLLAIAGLAPLVVAPPF